MQLSRHMCVKALAVCVGITWGAAQARADYFLARNGGELIVSNSTPTTVEGVFGQFIFIAEGPYIFDTVQIDFTITLVDPDPDLFAATFVFNDSVGQTMIGTIDGVRFVDGAGDWSGSGEWTVTGGTGQYDGFTGGGSFTYSALPGEGSAFTSFEGDVVPAPGAAIMLLLGGGIPALRRRR